MQKFNGGVSDLTQLFALAIFLLRNILKLFL